jgi:hypothetical protein
VSLTTAVDFVIQEIVRLAMITAKESGKNNILPTHIVNDTLKSSNVFAMIYNLRIINTHEEFLQKLDDEQKQKLDDKIASKEAAKEQRKKDRENDKKKPIAKKKVTKKTTKKDGDGDDEKKSEKKKPTKKAKKTSEIAKVKKPDKNADKVVVAGCEYLYYIDKIISVQKKELGDDYKAMRASSYFRQFCSNTIAQLIARMTNSFSILARLGGMKTITDSITLTAINIILTDYRVDYPELIDAVTTSVTTYRAYRLSKEKAPIGAKDGDNAKLNADDGDGSDDEGDDDK